MQKKGNNLFIISGPSGSGKDAVISQMRRQGFKFAQVITMTTRRQRKGESEGNPYHFVSKDEFLQLKKSGGLIEWAEVFGSFYGATEKEVETKLARFPIVVYKIDPRFGAKFIKKLYPQATSIFIIPESEKVLTSRVAERKSDSSESIKLREKEREDEYKNLDQWDEVVTNKEGELDKAAQLVREIITKKISGHKRKRNLLLFLLALVFLAALAAVMVVPSLISSHKLNKEFSGFMPYLNVLPDDIICVAAGEITPANTFFPTDLGKKGLTFLDEEENIALIIENNDPAALSNTIRKYWAYKYPSQRVLSLPDGSYTYEYYPEPGKFEVKTAEYEGTTIHSIVEEDQGIQMSWANFSSLSVISPSVSLIKSAILVNREQKTGLDLETLSSVNCAKISKKIENTAINLAWTDSDELNCWKK